MVDKIQELLVEITEEIGVRNSVKVVSGSLLIDNKYVDKEFFFALHLFYDVYKEMCFQLIINEWERVYTQLIMDNAEEWYNYAIDTEPKLPEEFFCDKLSHWQQKTIEWQNKYV